MQEAHLRRALDAIQVGEDDEALQHLLTAWRALPSQPLAMRIEAVSARIARPPVSTRPSVKASWMARAAEKNAADIDVLLDALVVGRGDEVAERLAVLAHWPADPRVSAALVHCLLEPPLVGPSGRGVAMAMLDLLVAIGDPVAAAAFVEAVDAERLPVLRRIGRVVQQKIASVVPVLRALQVPALDGVVEPLLDAIDGALAATKKLPPRDESALLEAIHADLADDAPRLVYADVLLERGDPRGELIVLQCERARTGARPTRRERELLGTYARAWLGPLDKVIMKRDLVYERGFLAACACRTEKKDDLEAAYGHPIWSTVTKVDLASAHLDMGRLLSHAACRNLRTVVRILPRTLMKLARPELEEVGIAFFAFHPPLLDKLAAMPKLRAIDISHPDLEQLRLHVDRRMPNVRVLTYMWGGPKKRFVREDDGTWSTVEL